MYIFSFPCIRWSLNFKLLFQILYMLSWSLIVRDMTPCGLVDMYRCFGVTCPSTVYPDSNTFLHKTLVDNVAVFTQETVFFKKYVTKFQHEVPKIETKLSLPLFTYFFQLCLTIKLYFPPTSYNKNLAYNMFSNHSGSANWHYVALEKLLISGMMIHIFWDLTPSAHVHSYQHFGVPCRLHLQGTFSKVGWLFINTYGVTFQSTDLFTKSAGPTIFKITNHTRH